MPETIVVVEWPHGHTYHGVEVRMTLDITLDEAMMINGSRDNPGELFDQLGSYLRGWNITVRGKAVPCTAEELRRRPTPFVVALLRGYRAALEEVVSVDDPFVEASNDGGTSAPPT